MISESIDSTPMSMVDELPKIKPINKQPPKRLSQDLISLKS